MFEQALDVVLKTLRDRSSAGARLRSSSEAIGRLVSARGSAPAIRSKGAAGTGPDKQGGSGEVQEKTGGPNLAVCSLCKAAERRQVGHLLQCGVNSGELLLVGEAECSFTDAELASFGGAAGELLLKMLKTMGLSRSAVNMVNVIVCGGAASRGAPELLESARLPCRTALGDLVKNQKPRVIVAMGANAAAALFEAAPQVGSLQSRWRDFEGVPVMTTFHATHLIQNPEISERRKVWEDLMLVMEKLGLPISERQRGFFLK